MRDKYCCSGSRQVPAAALGCWLGATAILGSPSVLWAQGTPSSEAGSSRASKLTPEERFERQQAKLQEEIEAEQRRMETYGVIPADDDQPLAVAYRQASEAFRRSTAEFADKQARLQFRLELGDIEQLHLDWIQALEDSYQALVQWRNRAAELYASDPQRYEAVGLMLRDMLLADGKLDRFDHWLSGARALLDGQQLVTDEVLLFAGYVGFAECDWEMVTKAWTALARKGILPVVESKILEEVPKAAAHWEVEKKRLEEDASKDNPRVELLTTKGILEIELFEDDAPESVASFIYLVENGYYDRKPIFLVKQHWLAQTGCEKGDGNGTAGYTIRHEAENPNARYHFRGYLGIPLGMDKEAKIIDPDSGGAQFYFSFLPLPILDGKHTVFGRIAKGKEAIGLFKSVDMTEEDQRKDPELRPDRIVRARVIHKRDHKYEPTPVLGRLPR